MNKRSAIDSRNRILDAAFVVFSQHGFEGTSMRTIAREADISVGGLYLYFQNKENLYSTLMERVIEGISGEMEEKVGNISDPVEAINTLITMRLTYARRNRELIIASNKEQRLALGIDMKKRFFTRQRRLIENIIEKGMQSGDFARCDAKESAKIIMGVLRGFVFSLVVDTDNLFSPEDCSRLILKGLLVRTTPSC